MGLVGDALFRSASLFGIDGQTGIFLGFIFLTLFLGFTSLVIVYAINGKEERSLSG
tara:strand:- start:206 stop:373 length:168 start_codon:yes stop_codon:yes gene_type:complete